MYVLDLGCIQDDLTKLGKFEYPFADEHAKEPAWNCMNIGKLSLKF